MKNLPPEALNELHYRECPFDAANIHAVKDAWKQFFSDYHLQETRSLLWEMCKSAMYHTSEISGGEVQGFLTFYEHLSTFMECSFILLKAAEEEDKVPAFTSGAIAGTRAGLAVQFLAEVLKPEKIFLLTCSTENNESNIAELLIVVPDTNKPASELEPILEFASNAYGNISCSLLTSSRLNQALHDAELFYVSNCSVKNLVYDTQTKELPDVPLSRLAQAKEKAKVNFNSGYQKAQAFYQGALVYCEKGNYAMGAFMLHQAVELCLRALILAFYGRDLKTHSVIKLQAYIKRIAAPLGHCLAADTEEGNSLLLLLDRAYSETRYNPEFTFTAKQFSIMQERTKGLLVYSKKFAEEMLSV